MTDKIQKDGWKNLKAYPKKIKFETDKPVTIKFTDKFVEPLELPNKNNDGVFYVFNCLLNDEEATFQTSAITLLKGLVGHQPLAGKELTIIKKNVAGKNYYYISNPKTEFKENSDLEEGNLENSNDETEFEDY